MNRNEPLLTVSAITAIVAAIIGLAIAFGADLTTDQTNAILGVVAVVAPIAVGVLARMKVSPAWKVPVAPVVVPNQTPGPTVVGPEGLGPEV